MNEKRKAAVAARRVFGRPRPVGLLAALALTALTFAWNVSSGPLSNLNDIGGWDNRLIFLLESAAAEALLLGTAAFRHRGGTGRLLLRQGLLALAFVMGLLAINQKTLFYQQQIQPVIRAMDGGGLAAAAGSGASWSAAMLTLLYALTRGPVYDMYPVKLLCILCQEALCLLAANEAERRGMKAARADAALLLLLILPQGFLSAACAAQTEVAAVLLAAFALSAPRRDWKSAALMGFACALSGVLLLILPWAALRRERGERIPFAANGRARSIRYAVLALGIAFACQVPAVLMGMPAAQALASPLRALLEAPPYASGSPNLSALFPRAAMEEMPEFFLLRRVPELDAETLASPFYTQQHFLALMRGIALTGLAGYAGACAWARKKLGGLRLWLFVSACALWMVPGGSMALWLATDCLCIVGILSEPGLRLPACLLLFATAAGCCYPVTGETLVRPALTSGLVLLAGLMLPGLVPGCGGKEIGSN